MTPKPSTAVVSIVHVTPPPPPPPPNRVRLELDMSLEDARGLYDLCGHITGSSHASPRRLTDKIYYTLRGHREVLDQPCLLNILCHACFNKYHYNSHE